MKNWIFLTLFFFTTLFARQAQTQTCPYPAGATIDVIVVWPQGAPITTYINALNATVLAHTLPSDAYLLQLPACNSGSINGVSFSYQGMSGAVGVIESHTSSVGASENYVIQNPDWQSTAVGNDPQPLPTNLFNCGMPSSIDMEAEVWVNRSGPDYAVKIAILDSGIDINNLILSSRIGSFYNCISNTGGTLLDIADDNGHGSAIASIYNRGMTGSDRYDIYKVLDRRGRGRVFNAIFGIDLATQNHVDFISASFTNMPTAGYYSENTPLSIAIEEARKKNILFLAASGNSGLDIDLDINHTVPVGEHNNNILGVGSLNCSGEMSSFSNYGQKKVDIFTYGENIVVWNHQGYVINVSGSSFATPVCGLTVLGLLHKQTRNTRNWEKLHNAITYSATYVESLKTKCVSKGILNGPAAACLLFKDCHTPVQIKVMLQGPYNSATGAMNDQLRALNLIPLKEPYTKMFDYRNGNQNETTTNLALNSPRPKVDWVLLELRDPNNPSKILFTRAALLTVNGDVVDTDGISPVDFDRTQGGSFYVAVRHRNHLGIRTASPIALGATPTILNFVNSSVTPTYGGTSAQKVVGSNSMMWAGDVSGDGRVKYNGSINDRILILSRLNGVQTAVINGYYPEDTNMNGQIKYNGLGNDRIVILSNLDGVQVSVLLQKL